MFGIKNPLLSDLRIPHVLHPSILPISSIAHSAVIFANAESRQFSGFNVNYGLFLNYIYPRLLLNLQLPSYVLHIIIYLPF